MSEVGTPELREGSIFHARYRVVRCIKSGGMGAVYEVVHIETRRRRALKVMLPSLVVDPDMRARFKLEATVTADVDSEHLVETFDAGIDAKSGAPFLVMELLRGEELAAVLRKRGALAPSEGLVLLGQAAFALDRTHDAGIVHRDLKPENLFVTRRDDGSPRLKVLDFGIAKLRAQSSQSAKTTRSLGTPVYMSPEQVEGDGAIDHRADLYALGHIAYTLLVGEAYWEKDARASDAVYPLLVKIMQGAREPASVRATARGVALPAGFDAWFAKATAVAPYDRFDSAAALVEGLATVLDTDGRSPSARTEPMSWEQAEAVRKSSRAEPSARTLAMALRRRSNAWPIVAVVAACALVAGGVLGLSRPRATPVPFDAGVYSASADPAPPPLPPTTSVQVPTAPATASATVSATALAPPLPIPTSKHAGKGHADDHLERER